MMVPVPNKGSEGKHKAWLNGQVWLDEWCNNTCKMDDHILDQDNADRLHIYSRQHK